MRRWPKLRKGLRRERVRVRGNPRNPARFHRFGTLTHRPNRRWEPDKRGYPHPGPLPKERVLFWRLWSRLRKGIHRWLRRQERLRDAAENCHFVVVPKDCLLASWADWRLGVSPDLAALLHIGEECLVKRRRGSESLRLRWVPAKDELHSRIRIVGCVGLI